MTIEEEIRDNYRRMGVPLAENDDIWHTGLVALSQYGYVLKDGFNTLAEAEKYAIDYYSSRMNLIRQ